MANEIGRRERRKERVRQALLDAAMSLLSERGIQRTRVEDITERTDLGKGAFYNYFESKDALVAELMRQGIALLESGYLALVDGGLDLSDRIKRMVELHDTFFVEHPQYVLLFHQARGLLQLEPAGASELKSVFASYLARIGQLLPTPEGAGGWSSEAREDLAAALVGAIAGYRSFRLASGTEPHLATIAEALSAGIPAVMRRRALHPASDSDAEP